MKNLLKKNLRRVILIAAALAVGGLVVLIAAGVYVYRHPYTVEHLIAEAITATTGLQVTTEELSYGLAPLYLNARHIRVQPVPAVEDTWLTVDSLSVRARITGSFGHRTLSIETLRIEDLEGSLRFSTRSAILPGALLDPGPPTASGRLVRLLVRYLLFAEITWSGFELVDGRLTITDDAWQLTSAGIAAKMTPQKGLEIRGRSLDAQAGSDTRVTTLGFYLQLETPGSSAEDAITGRLHVSGGVVQTPLLVCRGLSAAAEMVYNPGNGDISLASLNVEGQAAPAPAAEEAHLPTHKVTFRSRGVWRTANGVLELQDWSLNAADLMSAHGHARLGMSPPYRLRLDLLDSRLQLGDIADRLDYLTGRTHLPLTLSGDIGVSGHVTGPLTGAIGQWQSDIKMSLQKVPFSFENAGMRLAAGLNGSVAASGNLPGVELMIDVDAENFEITGPGGALKNLGINLKAGGRFPVLEVSLKTRKKGILSAPGDLRFERLAVEWQRGRLDLRNREVTLPRIALSASSLANLTASLTGSPARALVTVRGQNCNLVRTAVSLGFLPAGWQFHAEDDLDLAIEWQPENGITANGRTVMSGLRFVGPQENRIGEALRVAVDISALFQPENGAFRTRVDLSAAAGEILWDRYYLDLGSVPLAVTGKFKWDGVRNRLIVDALAASMKGHMALNASGSVKPRAGGSEVDLVIRIPETGAQTLYRQMVTEPYKYDRPALSAVEIGGRISAEVALTGGMNSLRARGRAHWKQGRISNQSGSMRLSGIELDLPFWYQASSARRTGEPLGGHLAIADVQLPYLPSRSLQLDFEVGPNRLAILRPPALSAFSGRMDIGPVTVDNLYTDRLVLRTDLALSGIDLDRLLDGVWPQPTGGLLYGRLESVRLEGHRLSTTGRVSADIFGGRIDIIDPGISGLMSSVPAIQFSCLINDLDLEKMTTGTGFGKITGILQGAIEDVDVVQGQPQRFDLRLETVQKKGVPQKINIRAVDNIARLGGSGSPFMGMAGSFAKIFREFPYRKIGIAASLTNDIFRVNGTIIESGTEYLVKKGGFSGVNVVNLNPDNRISFKDMVKRIKRISDSQDGPVIR